MTKTGLLLLAALAIPFQAFAVDGVVLINQSTVMATGGFPYRITQPGSYRLTGNLTIGSTQNGNLDSVDSAIWIQSNNVTLDLNGFSIIVTDSLGGALTHPIYAIVEAGRYRGITIRNGTIDVTSNSSNVLGSNLNGIYLKTSHHGLLDSLAITAIGAAANAFLPQGAPVQLGSDFVLNRIRANAGFGTILCSGGVVVNSVINFMSLAGCATSAISIASTYSQ